VQAKNNLTLATRLALGFAALIALLLATSAYSWWSLYGLQQRVTAITGVHMGRLGQMADFKDHTNQVAQAVRNLVLADSPAEKQAEAQRVAEARAKSTAVLDAVGAAARDAETQALLKAIGDARGAFWAGMDRAIALGLENKDAQARTLLNTDVRSAQATYFKAIDALADSTEAAAKAAGQQAESAVATASLVLVLASLAAVVVGALTALLMTRWIASQLGGEPADVVAAANAMAQGDLSVDIRTRAGDRASIMAAMLSMRERLSEVVGQVRLSSDRIADGSSQIATGNADLSQRTEQQASNLQQTTASMEQLTGIVRTNADTAQQANRLAGDASGAAAKGGEMVGAVVSTMNEIAASSKKIADIIGTIDGIAFQTNILALNAAVEAARAGEQGRGFAVVASEVRSLAQRSANAAKEIKTLISASVEKVEIGARQVNDAGASMDEIVAQVGRVSQLISEISHATAEQTSGIGQVGDAVGRLDQVTQQNAALVEESAAAAESLRLQAARLTEVVGVFKLSQGRA
jgi:methyl-accepting chemotaxis protein